MKLIVGLLLAACLAVAGSASAGKDCPHAKKVKETKTCPYAKMLKGKDCGGCGKFMKEAKALRDAGATMELASTKRGYVVLATAGSPELVAKVRKFSADRAEFLAALCGKAAKMSCENCAKFAKSVKSGDITFERVEVKDGAIMIYRARTDEAKVVLKNCCGAHWGLKA